MTCSSLSPEGWVSWEKLLSKSRAPSKKPPSIPPRLGGNPSGAHARFDALSTKVESLASGMDMLVQMMLRGQSASATSTSRIPHVLPQEGNVAQSTSVDIVGDTVRRL